MDNNFKHCNCFYFCQEKIILLNYRFWLESHALMKAVAHELMHQTKFFKLCVVVECSGELEFGRVFYCWTEWDQSSLSFLRRLFGAGQLAQSHFGAGLFLLICLITIAHTSMSLEIFLEKLCFSSCLDVFQEDKFCFLKETTTIVRLSWDGIERTSVFMTLGSFFLNI